MEGNNNEADKEPKLGCCARSRINLNKLGQFIYNSETKEVLGRKGLSWLKILTFYVGFYACLAGFWAACLAAFLKTLDPHAPTMQKMFSMMKDNPGMNYEPFNDTKKTLIVFNASDSNTYNVHVQQLTRVFSEYENRSKDPASGLKDCTNENGATEDKACRFDMSQLGNCTPDKGFGYREGKPCVLLRINKVFIWDPRNLTFDREDKCPNDSKEYECKKHSEFLNLKATVKSQVKPGYISVSCDGENDGDRDSIKNVSFYPEGGFPANFYPYHNQPNYTTPLVMAQFDVVPGRLLMILCQIWTRDIIHDKNDLQGSIHFELLVDNTERLPAHNMTSYNTTSNNMTSHS